MAGIVNAADVLQGRLTSVVINTDVPAEIVGFTEIPMELVQFDDVPDESEYQTSSRSVKIKETFGYETTIAVEIDEIVTADILAIRSTGDEIVIATSNGGLNGTGKTLTMAACDKVDAYVKGGKTYITAQKKSGPAATGYTITDNA